MSVLRCFQTVNGDLEKLLEEERLARRDEELVRTAQARFIADELETEAEGQFHEPAASATIMQTMFRNNITNYIQNSV
jgi:hypothetical protein